MAQSVPAAAAHEHTRLAWRTWVPWALVVLAAVIGLVAALNVWVKRQALSTDNFTNASSQLIENEQIRGALSVYLVNQLYANVEALWRESVRRAHEAFLALLNGKHNLLVSTNGQVVLDLRPLVEQLAAQFGLSGERLKQLPPDAGQIVILKGNQLQTARRSVKVVRALSYFLLFLVLALFAAAIWLADGRRRKLLMGCGVSVLIVGLIVLVVRRYAGNYLVDALTNNPEQKHPISAVWAIETQLLRNVGINAVVYGIGIMFAAWIAGTSRAATWIRRQLAPTMRSHPVVIYAAVALALFLVLISGPTDAQRIYPLLILFAFAFVGTEVLRRQTEREFPAAGGGELGT